MQKQLKFKKDKYLINVRELNIEQEFVIKGEIVELD